MIFPRIRLPQKLTQKIGKLALTVGRKKPGIFLVTGIILGGGALIMTVAETWDNKETIEEDLNTIGELKSTPPEEGSEKEHKQMLQKAYCKTGTDIFKAYWKPVLMGGTSIVLIVTSHKMLKRSLAEMAAMYAGLLESYRQYRRNVVVDQGALKDQEYLTGSKEVTAVDLESGEVTQKVIQSGVPTRSPYSVWYNEGIFDEEMGKWVWRNPLYRSNKRDFEVLIRNAQNACNDILKMRGYMFLNEVLSELGLPPTLAGQHVGWVRKGFIDGSAGDDYIDFGVFPEFANGKYQLPVNRQFLDPNSNQRYPLLDFNVICIDAIFDDIFEYDNKSGVYYDKRKPEGIEGSEESLNRWIWAN